MAKLTSRWYRDERDRDRILRLVAAAARHSGPDAGLYHPGDVVWGLFQNCTIDPATRVRLFEDGRGALRGFAWLHGGRDFSIHQNTARPLAARDLVAMIRWVEEHLGPGEPFRTELAPPDELRHGLIAAGYRPTGEATFQLNAQGLDRPIPEPALPAGAAVRPVRFDDPAEVAARVALHREVWEPSKFTAEGYERLRAQPVYRPDLDLVAVTPEGELAAYCIVWWDPVSRSGLFEPVGAAVAHRRRGYATALLRDALRRLHALGAGQAMVVSATGEEKWEPSRRLYASAGFATLFPFEQWERASGAGAAS